MEPGNWCRCGKHRRVLLVVDQPASIGALPVIVARDARCTVAYLSGLTMCRIADPRLARRHDRTGAGLFGTPRLAARANLHEVRLRILH